MPKLRMLLICLVISMDAGAAEIRQCAYPDGTVEWRDRPCPPGRGIESSEYETGNGRGTLNTIPADRPPEALLERAKGARRQAKEPSRPVRRSTGPAGRATELRCAEYLKRIDAIQYRLRKGYTVSEGNELRAERRRIERLVRDACR